MRRPALLVAFALSGTLAAPALAHEGNPNFESLVTAVDGPSGLKAQILNGDDRVLLVNDSRATVVVEGYEGEPYARLHPDGRVEVNERSPATYLNEDRFGEAPLPAGADEDARPRWRLVARNGRFEFHDHRMHWMSRTDPPQVRDDRSARRRVFDWSVPLRIGGRDGAVRGTLWWRGDGGGAPAPMFAGLAAFALIAAGFVLVVRRGRRAPAGAEREAW